MTRSACLYLLCTLLGLAWTPASASAKTLPNQLELREIGPWRGGRVTTVSGVPGDPMRYYMGAAGGGVWRTINGGASWENLSDGHFRVGTIGAIAVAPSDPKVLWVGTGEAPIRGVTTSHGDGVWRSVDEGASWTHLGLKDAGQISRIKVHPQDPDTAWIAVQGQIWGPSEQRGVFKTTDGGASWEHVLKVNASTGAADLAMDPNNPDHLYAALWHHGRTPWFILSGGEGGGIYKSTDGGSSWRQVTAGLPALVGKIGLDLAASMPSRLYAIVEAELGLGGLYVSDDFGEQWRLVNGRRVLHSRPWYYNHITVDPTDADTVWVQNVPLMKSTDGGVSFERVSTPHVDHHDHWINPDNPLNMISGNDGGGTITYDGGETWSSQLNQPTAQFYRVIADRQQPFRIYGGQQDNTTLSIASASATGGIGADDAYDVGGGESAHIAFDPDQPTRVYATTINNTLTEYDHSNNHQRSIVPYPEHVYGMNSRDLKYRANWNAPVLVSAHDPSVIYYGTQLLLKSTDRGRNWREISPDLTRNEPEKQGLNGGPITPENVGAEFYNTLFYLAESPQSAGTIWAGADDGLIHLTRDDGDSWSAITPAEAPEGQVNAIELSPHRDGKAYYALTRYKLNDFRPYIYRTGDFGQSWQRIDGGLPDDSFVRVVREDPRQEGVLYAGTEQGLWLSWNEGKDWQAWQMNLPPVPITDLTVADDSLVIATQGRGFWILDDLALLRQMQQPLADKPLHLFQPQDAQLGLEWSDAGDFEGSNPPADLVLSYSIGDETALPIVIEILDSAGQTLRRYGSEEGDFERCRLANMDLRSPFTIDYPGTDKGLHQWHWDLRRAPLKCIDNARIYVGHSGAFLPPGDYQARITRGAESASVGFTLRGDPRQAASAAQWQDWESEIVELTRLFNDITGAIESVRADHDELEQLLMARRVPASEGADALAALKNWERSVTQLNFDTYEDEDSWPTLIDGQVATLLSAVSSAGAPVAPGAKERQQDLSKAWAGHRSELTRIRKQLMKVMRVATGPAGSSNRQTR